MKRLPAVGAAWSRLPPVVFSIYYAFARHPVAMLARQSAFSLLYALPAMLTLLLSLATLVDRYTHAGLSTALQNEIDQRAPEEFQALLDSLVQYAIAEQSSGSAGVAALVALVVTLWSGAGGTGALVYACNRVFDVTDSRPYVVRKLLALTMTVAGGALVIVAFALVLLGEWLNDWIAERSGWSSSVIDVLVSSPYGSIGLIFAALAMLYWLAPDVPRSFRWVLPGAFLGTLATMLAFLAFDLLVGVVDPGSAFGAVGSVLVLLWLLDLVSLLVVSGAAINAALSHRYDEKMIAFLHEHPERRLQQPA